MGMVFQGVVGTLAGITGTLQVQFRSCRWSADVVKAYRSRMLGSLRRIMHICRSRYHPPASVVRGKVDT
jgi:hypothetical protein